MVDIREQLIQALEQEIVGPSPNPEYLDEETGEELLLNSVHGSPQARYGAAMLYPKQIPAEQEPDGDNAGNDEGPDVEISDIDKGSESKNGTEKGAGADEEPVGLANQFKPSAMGFTVRFNSDIDDSNFTLSFESAKYEKGVGQKIKKQRNKDGVIENSNYNGKDFLLDYWVRRRFVIKPLSFNLKTIFENGEKKIERKLIPADNKTWLKLSVFNRTTSKDKEEGYTTVTFTLVNDIIACTDFKVNTANILFQNKLILTTNNADLIAPYKEKESAVDTPEEKELNLLYRKKRIYAIGHGTAVTWEKDNDDKVIEVKSSVLPTYEMPQIAPTPYVELNMYELSDQGNWEHAKQSLLNLQNEYEKWVDEISYQAETSPELVAYREAAIKNVEKCRLSLSRIKNGINILLKAEENSDIVKAFKWMNRSMIWQQQRSKTQVRKWELAGKDKHVLQRIGKDNHQKFSSLKEFQSDTTKGRWRPFQLAFVLMNLESTINPQSKEREIVDLIWFPTGGGKTEAYLGITAFTIFYRRLKGQAEWNWDKFGGTVAIMRYTLRLLTTQQYERAASLICGCDLIRIENEELLGPEPISIGLWVGGTSTPNKHSSSYSQNLGATEQYKNLLADNNAEYNFIVMKCPCCASQIGKLEQPTKSNKVKGLSKTDGKDGKVHFKCENSHCEYADKTLPLQVVDEYIYENPPSLVLGTVDKFAMITWNSDAGKLFGFRDKGDMWTRITPPELIIQDELHLISGPLGTMVGLYEMMVQTLCNDYRSEQPFISKTILKDFTPPKIIASSATISRAYEQVKSLYAISDREKLNIFPAQGLTFGDTWFSKEEAVTENYPGRKYVGILAPGYPSMQTAIVRAYASVLQKVGEIKSNRIDYYWTLLGFFNSIRELGGASSLVFSDIRERLSQIHQRELTITVNKRFIKRSEELTSRISSSEIPNILKKLEENYKFSKNKAIDICLATNMVATGVDISRLGIIFIHGQPKTTAEYIQASSRVGRNVPDGPGLILTLYSPSKPRDKSQYEQFYSYHSRIYSNVEPTSVTPFSISARQRALHAILIGLVRHFSSGSMRDYPLIDENEFGTNIEIIKELILSRCKIIDPDEVVFTEKHFDEQVSIWKRRSPESYGDAGNFGIQKNDGFFPLMYSTGNEVGENVKDRSFPTPTSMRGVDSESQVSIIKS